METLPLIIGLCVVTAALGLLAGRYFWPAPKSADQVTLANALGDARRFSDEISELKTRNSGLGVEFQRKLEETARLDERNKSLEKEVAELRAQESKLQQTLKTEFENIATRVLKENASELSERSQKQIDTIVAPLRDRIREFQEKVEKTYETENREVLSLKEQIKLMHESSQNIGSQADRLAKALKGDVQMLGRWGELVLDRILQAAGLVEGREYITQGRGLGLKSEAGSVQKPDVIVKLPENRMMVIDSKVSLASYDRLTAAKDEVDRLATTRQLVRDVQLHIDGLAGKRYQDNEQLIAHECVLMFVPIEGALAAAITADPKLFTYAWNKRVVMVGPSTLLMTLRTVASVWRYQSQAENWQNITKLAGTLCDKVSDSLKDLNTVADKLQEAQSAHNEAVKRLSTGQGNALSIGERIRNLGVSAKKCPRCVWTANAWKPSQNWPENSKPREAAYREYPIPICEHRYRSPGAFLLSIVAAWRIR